MEAEREEREEEEDKKKLRKFRKLLIGCNLASMTMTVDCILL
jgi:hypothetical protein